jgi:hypothetical protein
MVHLLIIVLGIAAYVWSDVHSNSIFFNFVLPLAFFVSVLYAMGLGVVILRGRGLGRRDRESEALRFLEQLNKKP